MVAVADRHVAEVTDVGARQDFPVALAQAAAQLVLVGENAVLGEPAEFDVPVEHHHLMSLLGHDIGDGQPGRSGADDDKDRKSTRLNSSHVRISYAVFCLKKKNKKLYSFRAVPITTLVCE